jgi:hypothetical protein
MTLTEVLARLRALDKHIAELRMNHDAAVLAMSEAAERRDSLIRASLALIFAQAPPDEQLAFRLEGDYGQTTPTAA